MFRRKEKEAQQAFWIPTSELVAPVVNPFYEALDRVLAEAGFHEHVREACRPYYDESGPGRPGIDPVVYFKMLIVGFFEGIPSERAIAARCADSLSIRHFLRYELTEATPHHSSLTRIRQRLPEIVFEEVFALIVQALKTARLVKGRQVGVDASVIEANASMRALRHKMSGTQYADYVRALAAEAGVDPEDEAAVRRFDKKRKGPGGGAKKVSNQEFEHPHDPDAKIGRTKRGETRMLYKTEHVVDLETGAILDADILPGDQADTTDLCRRLLDAQGRMNEALRRPWDEPSFEVVAADKGYYDTSELADLQQQKIKTVVPDRIENRRLDDLTEPERKAVRAARRSTGARYGKQLSRRRSNLVERTFQHTLDCGGARRTTLRGRENVLKRYLIQATCTNLSLLMRKVCGVGTPKQALAVARAFAALIMALLTALRADAERLGRLLAPAALQDLGGRPSTQDQPQLVLVPTIGS
jgi:transposase